MGQKNKGRPKRHGEQRRQRPEGRRGPPENRGSGRPDEHKPAHRGPGDKRGPRRFDARKPQVTADGESRSYRSGQTKPRNERDETRSAAFEDRRPPRGKRAGFKARPREGADEQGSRPDVAHKHSPANRDTSNDGVHARPERLWIYGRHAAIAAISNPNRAIKRILVSGGALDWINDLRVSNERLTSLMRVAPSHIEAALHTGAVHQGIAVEVEDLPRARLKEDCAPDGLRPVVVLDQITDAHNIGAIIRSAAAFNARAIVVQDRKTPPLAGALAKAAAGAVELVPCVQAVNIARSLEGLKALGYFCAGLAGDSGAPISSLPKDRPIALVLGAEGAGLRKLVRETCDGLYAIPIARGVDSLNVSNAAAVALYEASRRD